MGEDNNTIVYIDGEPVNKVEPVELTTEIPPEYLPILTPEVKEFICNLGKVIVEAWEKVKKAFEPFIPLLGYLYKSNNWRKRHGIPMRRRGGKRKNGRRKNKSLPRRVRKKRNRDKRRNSFYM